jgi:hypothetical protein
VNHIRICQLLVLTRLAPEIQADLDDEARTTPVPSERELRAIAALPAVEQVWKYMELTGELVDLRYSRKVARLAGFRRLFARARPLRERYDSGQYVGTFGSGGGKPRQCTGKRRFLRHRTRRPPAPPPPAPLWGVFTALAAHKSEDGRSSSEFWASLKAP